jgi:serine protease inhibitor
LPANGTSVINANNHFAFDFLHTTLQRDIENTNKLISPLSIYLALSMVYNGAENATKDSMAKVLQLSGININDLNAVCNALITQLPEEDSGVELAIANSIWYNQNFFQPLNSFLNVVHNSYEAAIEALDFGDPVSVKKINDWVAENTNHKITKIINGTSSDDLMYLINAIYFNGAWQYKFTASNTRNEDFHLQDGSIKPVPFMQQKLMINYYNDGLFTLIELPYGGGKSYSMYIVLPKNNQQPVNTFTSLLDESALEDAISKKDSIVIDLHLPKWEYSYDIPDMKPELSALGMDIAFTQNADFSGYMIPARYNLTLRRQFTKLILK